MVLSCVKKIAVGLYFLTATTKALKPEKNSFTKKNYYTHRAWLYYAINLPKKSIIKNNKIMYIVCVDGYAKVVIIVVINHKKKLAVCVNFDINIVFVVGNLKKKIYKNAWNSNTKDETDLHQNT